MPNPALRPELLCYNGNQRQSGEMLAMPNPAERESENAGTQRLWRFGHVELDERSLELRVRGEPAALEPKPLEVLFHLLHHAGEIVTKDELAEACWPRRILSDSVLTKTVSRLREVIQDDDQSIIRTVHGYGYRLVAQVSVVASGSAAPETQLAFKPGDRLSQRPHWVLVEQLGSGRSGEVWLVRHDRTGEQRVYKFPLDVLSLGSLKREITLSRLLAETGSGRVARVFDWNLEQEPYFLEYEYAAGGNLSQWVQGQGGLLQISLQQRIDFAVQIAETLALAHSVGVLHKDLKPANVLVDVSAAAPRLKLSDFGSGGVLDPERLEALGITRLGFTRTLAVADVSSGTPLYLAPETLAGQPATVQGDIYALGVMLYQLVIGDFRKPLAPGWELEIEDEILREDIADAAAGDPRRRLADAGVMAERLRTLDERRLARLRQKQRLAQAEAERVVLERLQARRKWMLATMAALMAGTVISLGLFIEARRARNAATESAATSQAVAGFLSADIFSAISKVQKPPREWTVIDLLNSASGQIDERFGGRPEVAAQLHAAMGGAYSTLDQTQAAESHLQRAMTLAAQDPKGSPALMLEVASRLVVPDYLAGRLLDTVGRYQAILDGGESGLGAAHPAVQKLRSSLAWSYSLLGDWPKSLSLMRRQALLLAANSAVDPREYANALRNFGATLTEAAEFDEAEKVLRDAEARFMRLPDSSEFIRMSLRVNLIDLLIQRGRHAEAQAQIAEGEQIARRWAPGDNSQYLNVLTLQQAQLLLEQRQPAAALPLLDSLVDRLAPESAGEVDLRWLALEPLAVAHLQLGHLAQAESVGRQALETSLKTNGVAHPLSLRIRVALADVLRQRGRIEEAWSLIDAADPRALALIPVGHPILAERQRVRGLLLAAQGHVADAQPLLAEAQRLYERRLGPDHWRTRRVGAELAAFKTAAVR